MSIFDKAPEKTGDHFARHNPDYLKMFFGTADVTPLWVADIDLPLAPPILDALQNVVDRGQFAYEYNSDGVFAVISDWNRRRHGLELDPAKFVAFPGVLTAISLLIRELSEAGEGVLIQTPAYHQFAKIISAAGRKVVESPLRYEDTRYQMDFDDLEHKLADPATTLMILCNPHNSVGRVWRPDELERLLHVADRNGVTIISDEIHSDIIFKGHRFTSLAALDGGRHVSVIGSPAKTFGLHSISGGYIYTGNQDIHGRMKALAGGMHLGADNAFTAYATIAAYERGGDWLDSLLDYLEGTIEELESLNIPGVAMIRPEGTYQVWLDCSGTGLEGDALKASLGEAGFGATPGTWFDAAATTFLRVNIAAPRKDILDAFARFARVLATG